jgi:cell division transport system permease protein
MSRNKPAKRPKLTNEGFLGRLGYFTARAVGNIRQNYLLSLLTVGTIALAMLIISLFLLVFVNLEGATEDWSKRVQVVAYFEKELSPQEVSGFRGRIGSLKGTAGVVYVTKNEALARFRERLKGQESLLEGVSPDVLPSSLEISLNATSRNADSIEIFVANLKRIPGIGEVQYGGEWVGRFTAFMSFLRLVGALLGGFLLLAVMFIISNTIKLTIYARKDELEILNLVGATRFFIKAPFLIEGIIHGAVGSLIAVLTLGGFYLAFMNNAANFLSFNPVGEGLSFLPAGYLAGLFAGGVLLGFVGSITSLRRFIN